MQCSIQPRQNERIIFCHEREHNLTVEKTTVTVSG